MDKLSVLKVFWAEFDKINYHTELVTFSKEGSRFLSLIKKIVMYAVLTIFPIIAIDDEIIIMPIKVMLVVFFTILSIVYIYIEKKTYSNDYTDERLAYAKKIYEEYKSYCDEKLEPIDKCELCDDDDLNKFYIEKINYHLKYNEPGSLFSRLDNIMYKLLPLYYAMIVLGIVTFVIMIAIFIFK